MVSIFKRSSRQSVAVDVGGSSSSNSSLAPAGGDSSPAGQSIYMIPLATPPTTAASPSSGAVKPMSSFAHDGNEDGDISTPLQPPIILLPYESNTPPPAMTSTASRVASALSLRHSPVPARVTSTLPTLAESSSAPGSKSPPSRLRSSISNGSGAGGLNIVRNLFRKQSASVISNAPASTASTTPSDVSPGQLQKDLGTNSLGISQKSSIQSIRALVSRTPSGSPLQQTNQISPQQPRLGDHLQSPFHTLLREVEARLSASTSTLNDDNEDDDAANESHATGLALTVPQPSVTTSRSAHATGAVSTAGTTTPQPVQHADSAPRLATVSSVHERAEQSVASIMALHVPPPTQHASIQPTTTTTTVAPPSPPQLPEEVDSSGNPVDVAEEYVRLAIQYHEQDDLEKATSYFRRAAERGNHIGMLMMGLSLRHGWGCAPNASLAFQYLQKAAESAVFDLHAFDVIGAPAAKNELAMAIFELGISFRHGWGVAQNKATAAYYFEIAANLGDADAQLELAFAYEHGDGVRKDLCKAAKYYRLAHKQGHQVFGTSWIWKPKFDS